MKATRFHEFALLLALSLPVASLAQTSYLGVPVTVPAIIQAENFDLGGEGVAYHDNGPGNTGGHYRSEDVDIIVSREPGHGAAGSYASGYVVTDFETGEWLGYSINVPASGSYNIKVRASSGSGQAGFHLEINGQRLPATGSILVPETGGAELFQWVDAGDVSFNTPGVYFLKIVSDQQYFDFNAIWVASGAVKFSATFDQTRPFRTKTEADPPEFAAEGWSDDGNWWLVEQPDQPRVNCATLETGGRDGGNALRLHTAANDAGARLSCDVALGADNPTITDGFEGRAAWWAHSIKFPTDHQLPPTELGGWEALFSFHQIHTHGVANFNLTIAPDAGCDGRVCFHVRGGSPVQDTWFPIGFPPETDSWYDMVYHVKWSSDPDTGVFWGWVNGALKMDYKGPTLYPNDVVYLRLENYHCSASTPPCPGSQPASSVSHDRVVRGTTPDGVRNFRAPSPPLQPLQGAHEESAATYTGSWLLRGSETGTFNGGALVASTTAGDTATFTFTGTRVMWMGVKCNVCGTAAVSINGGAPTTVDTAGPDAPGSLIPEAVYVSPKLPAGTHTMVITVAGGTDRHVAVDGFYVSTLP